MVLKMLLHNGNNHQFDIAILRISNGNNDQMDVGVLTGQVQLLDLGITAWMAFENESFKKVLCYVINDRSLASCPEIASLNLYTMFLITRLHLQV